MNQKNGFKFTDKDALEIESKILVRLKSDPVHAMTYHIIVARDRPSVVLGA